MEYSGKSSFVKDNLYYLLFGALFVIYISTLNLRPYPFSYIVKILPVLSLIAAAFFYLKGIEKKYVIVGLIFSAVGDVLLDIKGSNLFVFGLSSFAAAHIMYVLALFRDVNYKSRRNFFSIGFIFYGLIIWFTLSPHLGKMLLPVSIYISLITLMGISSVLGSKNSIWVILGAILFIVSDSIIAINMFLSKVSHSSYWIMLTYFPAQFLITYGMTKKSN